MTLAQFNTCPRYRAEEELLKCCGSTGWVRVMAGRRPFASFDRLEKAAAEVWWKLDAADWMQAFAAHPRIGERGGHGWSAQEQSGVNQSATAVTTALEQANHEYLEKFGYIFIVCATGKSGEQMLEILRSRLPNAPEDEIRIAAGEQGKITRLRLQRLFDL